MTTTPTNGTCSKSASASQSGRDERGRFAKGNRGGPGNPFGRRVAQLRKAMLDVVEEEDLQAIVRKLIQLAREGDVAAARLVLAYTLGKPAETVDPDRVDIDDWQLQQEASVQTDDFEKLLNGLPVDLTCELAKSVWPCQVAEHLRPLREGLEQAQAADARKVRAASTKTAGRPEQAARPQDGGSSKISRPAVSRLAEARPSATDTTNGGAQVAGQSPPSPSGSNGHAPPLPSPRGANGHAQRKLAVVSSPRGKP